MGPPIPESTSTGGGFRQERAGLVINFILGVAAVVVCGFLCIVIARSGWPGDDPNQTFMGLTVKWWSRIGKGIQYVGGLTAIVDILGEIRLRRFSDQLEAWAQEARDRPSRYAKGVEGVWKVQSSNSVAKLALRMTGGVRQASDMSPLRAGRETVGRRVRANLEQIMSSAHRYFEPYLSDPVQLATMGLTSLAYLALRLAVNWGLSPVVRVLARFSHQRVNLVAAGFIVFSLGFVIDLATS